MIPYIYLNMKYFFKQIDTILFLIFLIASFFSVFALITSDSSLPSTPKMIKDAKPGDCAACHGPVNILPEKHNDTTNMNLDQCNDCHGKDIAKNLRRKIPLSHLHLLSDISCSDCHGKKKKETSLSSDDCHTCHDGFDAIVSLTSSIEPNPHDSHYGEMDCDVCHHLHSPSENFCNQPGCHTIYYVVP